MHDDNNVWMKQIKKLRKEKEYTCKAQRKKKVNLQLVDFEVQRKKKTNLVTCYREIDAQHY
jgi:hypothetical protein